MSFVDLRESLTILACVLILVLAVALAGPYFVDWNAQRSFLEARLSELLGEKVHLNGGIDLKLLPVPYLEASDIFIGSKDNPFSLGVDQVRLELSLPPLLRGEFAFTDLQLKNPVFRFQLDKIAANTLPDLTTKVKLERISLDDATILLENIAPGKDASVNHLNLEAEAESILGPFKAKGRLPFAGMNPEFSLSTGAADHGKLDLKLDVATGKNLPKINFAGKLTLLKDRLNQSNLTGQVQLERRANLPWALKGNLTAGLEEAKLDGLALQLGDEPLALSASGDGTLTYTDTPKASLNLKITSLDLDRFFASSAAGGLILPDGPPTEGIWPGPQPELSGNLKSFFKTSGKLAAPLPVNLNLAISNLLVSNARFSDISASIFLSQSPTAWVRAEGYGASRARLSFDGSIETGESAGLSGQVEWSSPRPSGLPDFVEQNLPPWGMVIIKTLESPSPLEASGAINLTSAGFFAHNLDFRQGAARLSGTLDYLAPDEPQRGRLFAALNGSHIALHDFSLPDAGKYFGQGLNSKLDLSLRVDADSLNLDRSPEPQINLTKLKLKLLETVQDLKLDEFEFTQSGGTSFRATGEIGQELGHFNVSLDAAHPGAFAQLLGWLWPVPSMLSLASAEQNFAPAHLRFAADANRVNGQMSLQNADLDANLGVSKFHAFLEREENSSRLKFDAAANAPDGASLWQQLGLPVPSSLKLGPGNFTIAARSKNWGSPIEAEIHAADASTSLDFSGVFTANLASPKGTGELDFKSKDLTPYLLALSKTASGEPWIAWPQTATKLPLSLGTSLHWDDEAIKANRLAGDWGGIGILGELTYPRNPEKALLEGNLDLDECSMAQIFALGLGFQPGPAKGMLWPDAPFGQGLKLPFETNLKLFVKNFTFGQGLSGENTSFEISLPPKSLLVKHFSSKLAGGRLTGDFELNRQANSASLEAKAELQDFQADLPLLHGKLGMKLNFAGSGASVLGLVKSLAGGGTADLRDAILVRSDPKALSHILTKATGEEANLDHDQITSLLEEAFSRAPLIAERFAFDLNLSDGHLRFGLPISQPEELKRSPEMELTGDFDLSRGWLTEKTRFFLQKLPKDWRGPGPDASLSFKGPLSRPLREIDSTNLSNALAEQSILKESERIANFEFDLHERAFFYERLRSERRREQDKLKLQDSLQVKAEEDHRRAAELGRSEHLKKDDQKRPVEEEGSSGGLLSQSGASNHP